MEQLKHFTHEHLLSLVYLRTENHHNEDSDNENSDEEDRDDSVVEEHHGGKCNMCSEDIYSFHMCYYNCKECDYSLHKFCAELSSTLQNHQSHPGHSLTLTSQIENFAREIRNPSTDWMCDVCNLTRDERFFGYNCSICRFNMDIICATMSEQKMVHPSHPHQLERMIAPMTSMCHACGKTNTRSNALAFPPRYETKYIHRYKVCNSRFKYYLWLYKCDKCWYYAHVDCATSRKEPFMSIFLTKGLGKTFKNFQDDDHPNMLKCPFPDESHNLLTHTFSNRKDFMGKENNGEMINHFGHQHPLVLFKTETSLENKSVSLHNPMKKIQLLCDGCVKPITMVPFYKCSQDAERCSFVLHTWCATLPSEIQDHPGHPEHSVLALVTKIPRKFFGIFTCGICELPSNGFAYECTTCGYYVDINCAFIPQEITHEAHPNHLLSLVKFSSKDFYCVACLWSFRKRRFMYHCPSCNFYLHTRCALLLPKIVRHKYDKHPLSLRYEPAENHASEYFCDICEEEFDPRKWFYHCTTCKASMHSACAPLILQCEKAVFSRYRNCVFEFLNVKFGGGVEIGDHPHRFTFVQGMKSDGQCKVCNRQLQYEMIFKCFECKFAFHHEYCASSYARGW